MIINRGNLQTLGVGFQNKFQNAFKNAASQFALVAMTVPSSTSKEEYGWLGEVPNVREWIGDRQVNNLSRYSYAISNRDWESTISVDRNDILDDNLGIYGPKVEMLGRAAATSYDQLVYPLLNAGFTSDCYDGQYFFDTDHPIIAEDGSETVFANTDGGLGTPWFLVAKNQPMMPIILQKRQDFQFVSRAQANDDNVFWEKKFVYGVDARHNVGFGLPHFAWGSKQTLDATHFNTAMAALMSMKTNYGRPIGITEFGLFVPPSLRANALQIVNADRNADGSTNVNYKTADLNIVPWLA
ncbi:MAG: Mu-like prophage major head subunit gpT family protein [Rhizomicrobium sp.]